MSTGESSPDDRECRLRLMYEETWRQYCHEDNLVYTRTKVFFFVQGALISVLIGTLPLFADWKESFCDKDLRVGFLVFGLVLAGVSIMSWYLGRIWGEATDAGMQYVDLRRATAQAIEETWDCAKSINLATIENKWRAASKVWIKNGITVPRPRGNGESGEKDKFLAFGEALGHEGLGIDYYNHKGSSRFAKYLAKMFNIIWRILGVLGIILATLTFIFWFYQVVSPFLRIAMAYCLCG